MKCAIFNLSASSYNIYLYTQHITWANSWAWGQFNSYLQKATQRMGNCDMRLVAIHLTLVANVFLSLFWFSSILLNRVCHWKMLCKLFKRVSCSGRRMLSFQSAAHELLLSIYVSNVFNVNAHNARCALDAKKRVSCLKRTMSQFFQQ